MALFSFTFTHQNHKVLTSGGRPAAKTVLLNTNRILRWKKFTGPDVSGNSVTKVSLLYPKLEDGKAQSIDYWSDVTETNLLAAVKKALGTYKAQQEIFLRIPVKETRFHGVTETLPYTGADPTVVANYPHRFINADQIVWAENIDTTNYPNTCYIYVDVFGTGLMRYKALTNIANLVSSQSKSLSV